MNTPTPPNTLYRFRSADSLLDKYQELENQTIYFANPDQLNDPMEGVRDIVWRGDKIAWANLFKHYVYCLLVGYLLFTIIGRSEELAVDKIPIPARWDKSPSPLVQRLFDNIWHRLLNFPDVAETIEALGNLNKKIRYRELKCFLRVIQFVFSAEILESPTASELISESEKQRLNEELISSPEVLELISILIRLLESVGTGEETEIMLQQIEATNNYQRINQQLNDPTFTGELGNNYHLMLLDFPDIYLKQVERLLSPNWYAACFMKSYHNSSVWGHYGDQHTGVCLIFKPVRIGMSSGLNLNKETGECAGPMQFSKVNYVDKPGEVDFFSFLSSLPNGALRNLWFTDEEGNTSSNFPSDIGASRDRYWDSLISDITTKTKDWEYEQEYRLILRDLLSEFDEEDKRKLCYRFDSLQGVIFGINTSDEHKSKIIKIILNKCEKCNRTDFKFYQAYYSQGTGDIRKYELPVDFS